MMTDLLLAAICLWFAYSACVLAWHVRRARKRLAAAEAHILNLSHVFSAEQAYAKHLECQIKVLANERAEWINRWKEGDFALRGGTIVPTEDDLEQL